MRDILEEQSAGSFTALFATICFVLAVGLGVLFFYSKDTIGEMRDEIIFKDAKISSLTSNSKHVYEENEKMRKMLIEKSQLVLSQEEKKEFKLIILTKDQEIAKYKAEIQTYEAILNKSNILTRALIKKVEECEND